jgi:hypothetical protein
MKRILILAALALPLAAVAQPVNTATITFSAPTQRVDGTPIEGALSYKLYQGPKGAPKAVVSTITTTSATVTTGLLSGREYCWQVAAFETVASTAGPDSELSNEGCKRFPLAPPAPVTITVQ